MYEQHVSFMLVIWIFFLTMASTNFAHIYLCKNSLLYLQFGLDVSNPDCCMQTTKVQTSLCIHTGAYRHARQRCEYGSFMKGDIMQQWWK